MERSGEILARTVLVAAIGNQDCGDDGVGPLVATRLAGRLPAGVHLMTRGGDMLALIEDWATADALVLVDAAAALSAPGRIHRIDLATSELPRELARSSTHAFGLADAIALARAIHRAPARIIVFAVEGARFETGAPMTPEVAAAANTVAIRIVAEAASLRRHVGANVHA